jgi:NAD(P)-dependent dehydrogenase (short-subunit alcohol dehydrogenase family)
VGDLKGTRALVIGASAGIGAEAAVALAGRGATVAVCGRRKDRLDEVSERCGAQAALVADVREPGACADVVTGAIEALGGLDALVYTAGASPLARVVDFTVDGWRTVLETNVMGLGLAFASAADRLVDSRGRVVAISSYSVANPKAGLVPYAASKAALATLMRGLRAEHPEVSFCTVAVANTEGTDFMRDFDETAFSQLRGLWERTGLLNYEPMTLPAVADQIASVVAAPMVVEELTLVGPAQV